MTQAMKKVVVFGGSGYVGRHICQQLLPFARVVSVNRSGAPSNLASEPALQHLATSVEWVRGDVLNASTAAQWTHVLAGADAVVSVIGGFGSNAHMERMCGDTNIAAAMAASSQGVKKFVFISAHMYNFPRALLRGYVQGKLRVEQVVTENFGNQGVIIRPSFVYGPRALPNGWVLPLGLVGVPLRFLVSPSIFRPLEKLFLVGAAFVPPISVDEVARAAAVAIKSPERLAGVLPPVKPSGSSVQALLLDVPEIAKAAALYSAV